MAGALFDWSCIRLAVFDVDGTLYRQRPVQVRMAWAMMAHLLAGGDPGPLRAVWHYRRLREVMGRNETESFEAGLLAETAARTGLALDTVGAIIEEWIEQRPLPFLARHRYPGLDSAFAALRRRGIAIGVLSDYPAVAKLQALGLTADFIISARDVGIQKPHPRGLESVIMQAGVSAGETVMIGDRIDRDGAVARRAGTAALIRSGQARPGWRTFQDYQDAIFCNMG